MDITKTVSAFPLAACIAAGCGTSSTGARRLGFYAIVAETLRLYTTGRQAATLKGSPHRSLFVGRPF